MRIMRSWMFVPGQQQRMIDKAYGLKLDVAMFDLEDGVPPAEKNTARAMMPETLDRPSGGMLRFRSDSSRWDQSDRSRPACSDLVPVWMDSH